jgi:hypothetical protein
MDRASMFDKALARMADDLDDVEGSSAMSHSMDECPDPLTCTQHDSEAGDALSGDKPAVSIEIHKLGMPTLDGAKEDKPSLDDKGEEGQELSSEDADILRKLLKA